jgi:hypothetical protein
VTLFWEWKNHFSVLVQLWLSARLSALSITPHDAVFFKHEKHARAWKYRVNYRFSLRRAPHESFMPVDCTNGDAFVYFPGRFLLLLQRHL